MAVKSFNARNGISVGTTPLEMIDALGAVTLVAGTTTLAPIKFIAGTNLTSASAGAVEWDGTDLFITQTTGPTRKTIAYTDSNITGTAALATAIAGGSAGQILYQSAAGVTAFVAVGSAGQVLRSAGAAIPVYSTATFADTYAASTILYSNGANAVTGLATANGGILNTGATGIPSITATPLLGVAGTTAGTLRFSGATSGVVTLATAAVAGTWTLTLPASAGSAGQSVYSTGTAWAYTTATYPTTAGTALTWLRSDGTNIINSTATLADTFAVSTILYASASNVVTGLATANGGIVNTGATGIPSVTATPLLGVAGTTAGTLRLSGLTSGVVTISTAAVAGTWSLVLPATAGSAGQHVYSTGTAWAYSTATYPTTAGGAGTFLRSNGTNWITSTLTIPDTYTQYSMPYASGTNVLGETGVGTTGQILIATTAAAPSWSGAPTLTTSLTVPLIQGTGGVGGTITIRGGTDTTGTVALNAAVINTSVASLTLFGTPTTVNFAGAGTTVTIGAATGTTTVNNSLVVTGNFTVNGLTTTLNTTNWTVDDKNIELGSVSAVSTVTGTSSVGSPVVTGMSTTAGLIPGMITTVGAGTLTLAGGTQILSVDSTTQVTLTNNFGGSGTSTTLNFAGASDTTANGGGITLKGATDKTILWDSTNSNFTSSENWNLATGKTFKINNVTVASATALTVGVVGTGSGTVNLLGTTSGTVSIAASAAAGSWTLTLPSTAGTSGQSVVSNGTTWVYSTATFPTTGGSAGTILRSNGTNFVNSTSTFADTYAAGTMLVAASANTVTGSATPTLGVAGSLQGSLSLAGVTSGTVSLAVAAAAGTWTLTLPNTAGSAGQLLRSTGTTWAYSTATFVSTVAANSILYANTTDTVTALTAGNNSVLVSNGSGTLSFSTTLPAALTIPGALVTVSATVTAAGTTQGTATALTSDYNVITTAAAGTGVVLQTTVAGKEVTVVNKGANPLLVYPAVSSAIDALGTNVGYTLAVGGTITFLASSGTQWYSLGGTIASSSVTNAMLAQMATLTIKGNNTGGASNPLDLTVAQVNLILPVFTGALNGLVPLSGGGTTNFLRADGTWTTPGGGGTVTSVSVVTNNGVSGSVATATTTPAITLTLGNITPTAVTSTGSVTIGSGTTGIDAVIVGAMYRDRSITLTTTATTLVDLDVWAAATYRSAKYVISAVDNVSGNVYFTEVLVTKDNSNNVYITEYGTIVSGTNIISLTADYDASTNIRLRVTPLSANSTVIKAKAVIFNL